MSSWRLRTRVFVTILLLRLLANLSKLLFLLLELRLLLETLLIPLVAKRAHTRHRGALLHGRPRIDPRPPLVQVRKLLLELHAGEVGNVHPAEVCNVCDRVFVADDVVFVCEVGVKDAVEALGFADVALRWVGDAFFG